MIKSRLGVPKSQINMQNRICKLHCNTCTPFFFFFFLSQLDIYFLYCHVWPELIWRWIWVEKTKHLLDTKGVHMGTSFLYLHVQGTCKKDIQTVPMENERKPKEEKLYLICHFCKIPTFLLQKWKHRPNKITSSISQISILKIFMWWIVIYIYAVLYQLKFLE